MLRTVLVAVLVLGAGCDVDPPSAPSPPSDGPVSVRDQPLQPLPKGPRADGKRVAIGARLFADPGLSSDGTVSCATCHPLDRGGADGLSHSRGVKGREMPVNTPTVYNASQNFRFNWNGAYATLEDEFDAPIASTLDTTWSAIDDKLRADGAMSAAFAAAYADGVTTANVKDALARYIESLTTPDSRFDQYQRGDVDALTADELRGYETFKSLGCASCHQGTNVGGNLFQRLGVMHDYFQERSQHGGAPATTADLGRFAATHQPADRHVFRVPSLRNVAMTPPYFHDGSVPTLEQAVAKMGYVQLGRTLTAEQVSLVVAFLKTLTGLPRSGTP